MAAWSLVKVAPDLGKSGKTNNGGPWQSIFLTFISKAQEAIGETINYLSEPRELKPFRFLNSAISLCGERLCPVLQHSWGIRGQRPELFSPCRFISHNMEMAEKLMMLRHEHRRHHAEHLTGTPSFNCQVLHQHHPNYTVKNTEIGWRDGLVVKSIHSQLLIICFLAPTWGASQQLLTLVLGNLMSFSGFFSYQHTCGVRTDIHAITLAHIYDKIDKNSWVSKKKEHWYLQQLVNMTQGHGTSRWQR